VPDILLSLDRETDLLVTLRPYQELQAVPTRGAVDNTLMVLPRPTREIAADTEIQGAVSPVCHQVYPSAVHLVYARDMTRKLPTDGRVKLGLDDLLIASHRVSGG
jgi:hypothetical protein